MATQPLPIPLQVPQERRGLQIDLDHAELLVSALSTAALGPLKNLLHYAFPFLRAINSNSTELRAYDPAQAAMMPEASKEPILREIEELRLLAGINRKIIPYAALNFRFSSCGGAFSLTRPALFLPFHHLFRPGKTPFLQERAEDRLPESIWHFSDDETRFLICRELAQIKRSDALLKTAVKICLLAAVFVFYTMPFGLLGAIALMAAAAALYVLAERTFSAKMDLHGVDILAKRFGNDRPRALQTAVQTLEKIRRQNIEKRENKLCRLYITPSGNNILDFSHPFLTTRISRLR